MPLLFEGLPGMAGIFLGMWIVQHFNSKKYHWTGISETKTVAGKVRDVLNFSGRRQVPQGFDTGRRGEGTIPPYSEPPPSRD